MLRTCDGTDENLIRYDHVEGEQCPDWPICKHAHPCDCGKTFDDVEYSVLYPHTYIPTPEEKQRIIDAYLASEEGQQLMQEFTEATKTS